jgi:cobalt-zinc-cadmium efflux system outer membrane protein
VSNAVRLGALLLAAAPLFALAQSGHAPLAKNPTLDFDAVLAAALEYAPEAAESSVRRQQADAYAAAGRSLLAGRPNLWLQHYNDSPLDATGQVETEYGVQLPLWRPGERRASQEYGARYNEQVALWQDALKLDIAGRLRTALADLHEAEVLLELERIATTTAEEVLRTSEMLFDAGALARVEVMQSRHLLLEQQRRLYEAEATLVDSEIVYEYLTGLDERPATQHTEMQGSLDDISENHPLLRYLQSEVAILDGAVRQGEISAKGNPQLQIASRRERGDRFTPYTDSVNLALTIPIGGKSYVDAQTSGARRDKVDAEVRYRQAHRELGRALHDAEHELFIVRQALPLAREQAALGEERETLARDAFTQAELTLPQVLLAVQEAHAARRELALLEAREQRLIAEYNQLTGVLP